MRARHATPDHPTPPFDDVAGWIAVPDVLETGEASTLAAECLTLLADLGHDTRPGDKAVAGTLHLVDLLERVPRTGAIVEHELILRAIEHLVGPNARQADISFRCPQPGYGGQRLHADWIPLGAVGLAQIATAIVALCDFTADNGATRVVPGSHLRPDQQRLSGNLERHPDEVALTGKAGTAFVFSGHLLHSGTVNRSSAPRPALQIIWRRPGASVIEALGSVQ